MHKSVSLIILVLVFLFAMDISSISYADDADEGLKTINDVDSQKARALFVKEAKRGEVIQIKQGNVGTFHELRLGVANIIKADYIDEAGTKKHGLIAVLTLFIEGNPPQEKDFKVYAGQKIIMDKYLVYVEEIRGTAKGSVTLRIEEISKYPTQQKNRLNSTAPSLKGMPMHNLIRTGRLVI